MSDSCSLIQCYAEEQLLQLNIKLVQSKTLNVLHCKTPRSQQVDLLQKQCFTQESIVFV